MKVLERVLESLIDSQVDINSMQFDFMSGRSTTDTICILQQLQEKHHIRNGLYKIGSSVLLSVRKFSQDWLTSFFWNLARC